jgi:hypothetical protein
MIEATQRSRQPFLHIDVEVQRRRAAARVFFDISPET